MSDDIPAACCLSDAELRERKATLVAQFRSAVTAAEELPNGFVFRVPRHKKWIAVAGELILAECECCPFPTFELAAGPNLGPVIVRVTGPAGTKDFLRTLFCDPQGLPRHCG